MIVDVDDGEGVMIVDRVTVTAMAALMAEVDFPNVNMVETTAEVTNKMKILVQATHTHECLEQGLSSG